MPRWKELKRFCDRDGWELYKNTDHYFYRKIDEDGNTALHLIPYGEEKSIPIAKLLLKYGADKTIENKKGLTAYEDYQKVEKDNNGDKSNEDRNLIYKEMDAILNK